MSIFSAAAKLNGLLKAEVGCTGKVTFTSFSKANDVLGRFQTKSRPSRSVYRCGHCGQWHIGTNKGRVQAKRDFNFKERKKNHDAT